MSTTLAVLGEPALFTCTATNAYSIDDEIRFIRKFAVVASVHQKHESCMPFTDPISANYEMLCGNGTNASLSHTKTYELTVTKVLADDLTEWWCALVRMNIPSYHVALQLAGKVSGGSFHKAVLAYN